MVNMNVNVFKSTGFLFPLILYCGIFILPFIMWSWGGVIYEIPRVIFFQRWIEVLVIIGFIFNIKSIKKRQIDFRLVLTLLVFLGIAIISSVLGADLGKSIWGNYYRGDGLVTLFHLVGFSLIVGLFWKEEWSLRMIEIFAISSFFLSIWTLLDGFRLWVLRDISIPLWENSAIGISFGNPNFLAGYLVTVLPFSLSIIWIFKDRLYRLGAIANFILNILAIIATNSWAGLLGTLLCLVLFLGLGKQGQKTLIVILGFIAIGIVAIIYFKQVKNIGFIAESRERIFRKVLMSVRKRPILGWGWANIDYAFENSEWPFRLEHDVYVDKAHATIIEILGTTGIVGLAVFIYILFRGGKILYLRMNENIFVKVLFISLVIYIIHSQTNIISIGEEAIFWFIVGLAIYYSLPSKKNRYSKFYLHD